MTYEKLMVEKKHDFIAEITLNRPEHLNTFDSTMAGELSLCWKLRQDSEVKKIYCAPGNPGTPIDAQY